MGSSKTALQRTIGWGVASRQLPGQAVCGDAYLVEPVADGVLMAVVDGLGHGDEAAAAAQTAVLTVKRHAGQPLPSLIEHCHAALMKTRGVVMTLATIHPVDGRLTWVGVGNVGATLLRAGGQAHAPPEYMLLHSGVVGYQLPQLKRSTNQIAPGELLVVATDGIGEGFVKDVVYSDSPQQIADRILSRHFQGHDDALVLVARYGGHNHE